MRQLQLAVAVLAFLTTGPTPGGKFHTELHASRFTLARSRLQISPTAQLLIILQIIIFFINN